MNKSKHSGNKPKRIKALIEGYHAKVRHFRHKIATALKKYKAAVEEERVAVLKKRALKHK